MKFSTKDFVSKCDQIHRKTADLVTFTKECLMENFAFCAVYIVHLYKIDSSANLIIS